MWQQRRLGVKRLETSKTVYAPAKPEFRKARCKTNVRHANIGTTSLVRLEVKSMGVLANGGISRFQFGTHASATLTPKLDPIALLDHK